MDDCPVDLTFQRDFNSLYIKYCGEIFGGRSGPEMFEKLDEKITSLKDHWEEASIEYHFYDNKNNSTFILTIVTPLTIRVQKIVC